MLDRNDSHVFVTPKFVSVFVNKKAEQKKKGYNTNNMSSAHVVLSEPDEDG